MVLKGLPPDDRRKLNEFLRRIDQLDASPSEKRRLRVWVVRARDDFVEIENMERD